jgi:predicted ATP-binding protein involved in virulence
MMLSWVVARIKTSGSSGSNIKENDINNNASNCTVISVANECSWSLSKAKKGHIKNIEGSNLKGISEYTKQVQESITESKETKPIPMFVYYPVNRAVLDVPLRIRKKHEFNIIETYENALISGVNFRMFFEWFRIREDLENENHKNNKEHVDNQLEAVRKALESFLPEFKNFCIKRNPLSMFVEKNGKALKIEQLSDGEKSLIAMVGDLARRLAIANPNSKKPLEGKGIVLIDEIDLHLHPSWQRKAIRKLVETFPNCQFIITTHSPQVISEVEAHSLRLLEKNEEGKVIFTMPKRSLGLDSSEVLVEIMESPKRNEEIDEELYKIYSLIDENNIEEANISIEKLSKKLNGDIPEIIKARSLITMLD